MPFCKRKDLFSGKKEVFFLCFRDFSEALFPDLRPKDDGALQRNADEEQVPKVCLELHQKLQIERGKCRPAKDGFKHDCRHAEFPKQAEHHHDQRRGGNCPNERQPEMFEL